MPEEFARTSCPACFVKIKLPQRAVGASNLTGHLLLVLLSIMLVGCGLGGPSPEELARRAANEEAKRRLDEEREATLLKNDARILKEIDEIIEEMETNNRGWVRKFTNRHSSETVDDLNYMLDAVVWKAESSDFGQKEPEKIVPGMNIWARALIPKRIHDKFTDNDYLACATASGPRREFPSVVRGGDIMPARRMRS